MISIQEKQLSKVRMNKSLLMVIGLLMSLLVLTSTSMAATKTKTQTLTYNYYDSIITSWKVGSIKAIYTYSYDTSSKKLVNQKSISVSTNTVGMQISDISKSWDWYNTKDKNGTGRGEVGWKAGLYIDTKWITIGSYDYYWMALTCKGDGTYSTAFS